MTQQELIELAIKTAEGHGLDPALVCAVCHHESNWEPSATRYEQQFYDKYIAPIISITVFGNICSRSTEQRLRAFSFGLMQIMGQVARERGCTREYLTELCIPQFGLDYGCLQLKLMLQGRTVEQGLLRYNGGGDPSYPKKVLKHYPIYQSLIEKRRNNGQGQEAE